jgi:hypothetical protein
MIGSTEIRETHVHCCKAICQMLGASLHTLQGAFANPKVMLATPYVPDGQGLTAVIFAVVASAGVAAASNAKPQPGRMSAAAATAAAQSAQECV